jgi:hypothetical protein
MTFLQTYLIVSTLFCALIGINGWSLHCRRKRHAQAVRRLIIG